MERKIGTYTLRQARSFTAYGATVTVPAGCYPITARILPGGLVADLWVAIVMPGRDGTHAEILRAADLGRAVLTKAMPEVVLDGRFRAVPVGASAAIREVA